ncbi:MAG: coenzyme F420-reducing hydrogenase beta subunit [Anaerocolumna sp.]|jgi:coenzyme F420 hydrogenase subunit beta|nr:coenzyme F420-reducing hydrogenase beta subunit [Anaerocolumna sp.]
MKLNQYINTYCTGCGLCHSVKGTTLEIIDRGFPNSTVEEVESYDFYKKVCPVFYYAGICDYDVWGKVDKAIVAYSSDSALRYKAASGGALTEISIYLIENRLVDGILHTTYDPQDSTKTISCVSSTKEEIIARCGSRYSISVPLIDVLQKVDKNKKYAFVGKPCDVMALRNYLAVNNDMESVFPFLLSFFCAGEPSVDAQIALLNKMGCKIEDCNHITYRGNGWPGYATVLRKDGTISDLEYKIAWGSYLGRDLRNICRFCLDGTGEAADIVCADFWYLDPEGKPEFSEHDGRNIIISRSKKGTDIMREMVKSGQLVNESDYTGNMGEFYKYQPHQYKRKGTMKSMILAMRLCGKKAPRYNRTYLNRYANHISSVEKIRFFAGTIKRIIKGRI